MSATKRQLGLVGVFPSNLSSAQKLSFQRKGSFSPDTEDFISALKQCKHIKPADLKDTHPKTPTIGEVLRRISSRQDTRISRIDLLTHGAPSFVGLSGRIWVSQALEGTLHNVYFADEPPDLLGRHSLEQNLFAEMMNDDQALGELKKARHVAAGAELHIYACKAGIAQGAATPLAQLMADALEVTTYLFLAEVGYDLKEDGKWGFHLRYRTPGHDPKTGAPNMQLTDVVDDYRDLDKLTQHITSRSPTKTTK